MVQTPLQTVRNHDRRPYRRWGRRPYGRVQTPLQTVDTHTPHTPQTVCRPGLGFDSPPAQTVYGLEKVKPQSR
jgi:hypothetical protein